MATASGIVGEFLDLKAGTDADVLAMQCGDFYEFFGEDAEVVSRELDLKISEKSSGGSSYPMAGVPVDDLTPYLRDLVERGYRVAIADQYETADGHAREVTRVVTPGTLIETTADAAYLVAIVRVSEACYGLAVADVTTGRCLTTRLAGADAADRLVTECYRFDPVEVLPGPVVREDADLLSRIETGTDAVITHHDETAFAPGAARATTREQFGAEAPASLGLETDDLAAVRAVGALLDYVADSGAGVLPAMTRLTPYDDREHVTLDVTTRRNLELTDPMMAGGTTVLAVIDKTVTTAGSRRLREWVTRPRRDRETLDDRLDAVDALVEATLGREALREILDGTADLARLSSRATRGSADARTLLAVARTLSAVPDVVDAIERNPALANSPLADAATAIDREAVDRLARQLSAALRPDPPKTVTEGNLLREGYDDELDELIETHETALAWVEGLAERERAAHGITHLQVDRNRTDGYYIQVGNSETDAVPERYREIKTLKNSKRYTTAELEEREREILRLEEARHALEYELFCELREAVAAAAGTLQSTGRFLAKLDALAALATHAVERGWVRPDLREPGSPIEIAGGRHPVVEASTEFVPNDVSLDTDTRLRLVTGPNMSGKSTYLRQTALIVLLAQVGSFVPASSASIGLVDGIYTRVGALDELSQGRSTFMVEMQELANILHAATEHSLVILDEVGRGTATYDGISIAWAATEFLHNEIRAKALFATHYHELTGLVDRLPAAANVHVAVDERDGEVTFLRTIRPGPADRSYGIYVAALAGVPDPVRDRAEDVLANLRSERAIEARGSPEATQAVFDLDRGAFRADTSADGGHTNAIDPTTEAVLEELRGLSVEETAPIDLLQRVVEWQERLETE